MQIEPYQLATAAAAIIAGSYFIGHEFGARLRFRQVLEAEKRGYDRGLIDQQLATATTHDLHKKRVKKTTHELGEK